MKHSLYYKFILGYLVFGLLGFASIATLSAQLMNKNQVKNQAEAMYDEANLIASAYSSVYQGAESYEDICVTKKMTRIGYGPDADIQIQADTISQLHARIDHDGEIYYIEDLNSTNGTFVNDEPLAYKERRKLNSNDMIRFADVRYRFC